MADKWQYAAIDDNGNIAHFAYQVQTEASASDASQICAVLTGILNRWPGEVGTVARAGASPPDGRAASARFQKAILTIADNQVRPGLGGSQWIAATAPNMIRISGRAKMPHFAVQLAI